MDLNVDGWWIGGVFVQVLNGGWMADWLWACSGFEGVWLVICWWICGGIEDGWMIKWWWFIQNLNAVGL